MSRYPNLFLTLLLALALIPPFVLKTLRRIEPYPAIILPAVAGKVDVGGKEVSFKRTSLWGKDKETGVWKRIDVKTFLAPIPVHYLNAIAENSFGLNSAEGRTIDLPKGFEIFIKKVTSNEVETGKQWLRQKLAESGYASDELAIASEQVNFDVETGQIITNKRIHEEILRLD